MATNRRNYWGELSLKDRAQFYPYFIEQGITSPKDIADIFNGIYDSIYPQDSKIVNQQDIYSQWDNYFDAVNKINREKNSVEGHPGLHTLVDYSPNIPQPTQELPRDYFWRKEREALNDPNRNKLELYGDGGNVNKDSWIKEKAYKVMTNPKAHDRGWITPIGAALSAFSKTRQEEKMEEPYMFLYGTEGRDTVENSKGKDYSKYLSENYSGKEIPEIRGYINPRNRYYVSNKNRGMWEELTKSGADFYSNADLENEPDYTLYRDDVSGYNIKLDRDSQGNMVAHAADIYDFGPDYGGKWGRNPIQKALAQIEAFTLNKLGKPYILRQDNIPVEFVANDNPDIEGVLADDLDTAIKYTAPRKEDIKKFGLDNAFDMWLARKTNSGYIEPSTIEVEQSPIDWSRVVTYQY